MIDDLKAKKTRLGLSLNVRRRVAVGVGVLLVGALSAGLTGWHLDVRNHVFGDPRAEFTGSFPETPSGPVSTYLVEDSPVDVSDKVATEVLGIADPARTEVRSWVEIEGVGGEGPVAEVFPKVGWFKYSGFTGDDLESERRAGTKADAAVVQRILDGLDLSVDWLAEPTVASEFFNGGEVRVRALLDDRPVVGGSLLAPGGVARVQDGQVRGMMVTSVDFEPTGRTVAVLTSAEDAWRGFTHHRVETTDGAGVTPHWVADASFESVTFGWMAVYLDPDSLEQTVLPAWIFDDGQGGYVAVSADPANPNLGVSDSP